MTLLSLALIVLAPYSYSRPDHNTAWNAVLIQMKLIQPALPSWHPQRYCTLVTSFVLMFAVDTVRSCAEPDMAYVKMLSGSGFRCQDGELIVRELFFSHWCSWLQLFCTVDIWLKVLMLIFYSSFFFLLKSVCVHSISRWRKN